MAERVASKAFPRPKEPLMVTNPYPWGAADVHPLCSERNGPPPRNGSKATVGELTQRYNLLYPYAAEHLCGGGVNGSVFLSVEDPH